ncbi:MAG TPA: hypothetical protein VK459_05935 [Polyangiaceae bacterium]|nr:hypothetical protein [Polyangiaceae bacterium]
MSSRVGHAILAAGSLALSGCGAGTVKIRPDHLAPITSAMAHDPEAFQRVQPPDGSLVEIRGPLKEVVVEHADGSDTFEGPVRVEVAGDRIRVSDAGVRKIYALPTVLGVSLEPDEVRAPEPGGDMRPPRGIKAGRLAGGIVMMTFGVPITVGGVALIIGAATDDRGIGVEGLIGILGGVTFLGGLGLLIPGIWMTTSAVKKPGAAPPAARVELGPSGVRMRF